MAITVVLEMQVKPEKIDEFLSTMETALKDTRAYQGCRSVITLQDAENPGRIVLWEEWDKREDQESYIAWRQTPEGAVDGIQDMVTAAPTVTYLNERGRV